MQFDITTLKLGLLFFWSLWFTLVFLTNLGEGMKELGALPESWPFVSENYKYLRKATATYALPEWATGLLFVGASVWEGLAALLFWRAWQGYRGGTGLDLTGTNTAFAVGLALWAAFMVADEVFRTYQQQTTHVLLFISQLLTLIALHNL